MGLLRADAERLTRNQLVQGVIEEIVTEDNFFNLLPFKKVNGKALVYNRENTLESSTDNGADYIGVGDSVPNDAATFTSVTAKIYRLIGDVDVDNFLQDTMATDNDQEAIQVAKKAKLLARKFKRDLINGGAITTASAFTNINDSGDYIAEVIGFSLANGTGTANIAYTHASTSLVYTPPGGSAGTAVEVTADGIYYLYGDDETKYAVVRVDLSENPGSDANDDLTLAESDKFDGLEVLVDDSQAIIAGDNGASLSYTLLDQLIDKIPGGPDFIAMTKRSRRMYKVLLRAAGGVDSAMMQLPNFGRPILTYEGIPIVVNDYIGNSDSYGTGTNLSSIYAGKLGELNDGLVGLYAGDELGIAYKNVGEREDYDETRNRLKWYCGLALYSTKSLAVLRAVNGTAPS